MANKIRFATLTPCFLDSLAIVNFSKDTKKVNQALFSLLATEQEEVANVGKKSIGTARTMPDAFATWLDSRTDSNRKVLVDSMRSVLARWGAENVNETSATRFVNDVLIAGSFTSNNREGGIKAKSARAFDKAFCRAVYTFLTKGDHSALVMDEYGNLQIRRF